MRRIDSGRCLQKGQILCHLGLIINFREYYDTYEEFKEASRYLSITVSEAISQDEESQDEVEEQREQPIRCLRRCTETKWNGSKYVIVKVPCPGCK